ncbi:helix-turn-helix domain-containing protein [Bacillus cereus]|nr:helix-turn-helix domain-containing protein [Bacillus cereus]
MNEFIKSFICDKATYRKLFILSTLDNGNSLVSANNIATKLNCSNRTVTNDISQLNNELPQDWKIDGIKTKGYILNKPLNDSIFPIVNSYIEKSNIAQIMLGIFTNKHYSLEKWSQLLYINKLTLKQNLKYHGTFLQKNDLNFKFRPIQLVGDELKIRHYYHIFFYMKKTISNSLPSPHDEILINKLSGILNFYGITITIQMLESIILVFITRFSYKQYITEIDTTIFPTNFNSSELECFNRMIIAIENHYKITLPKSEKTVLQLYFFLVSSSNFEQGKTTIEILKSLEKKYYENYLEFFNTITAQNNIKKSLKNRLFFELAPFYYKAILFSYFKLTREIYFTPLNVIPNELLPLYTKNLKLLSFWNANNNISNLKKHDLECLVTHATITIQSYIEKTNILFLYSGTIARSKIYYSMLQSQLGDSVKIYTNYNADYSYDFIISNTPQRNTNAPIFYISDNLSTHEIDLIKNNIFSEI